VNELDSHRYLPDANRLSVLAATIFLAYALSRYINLPERQLALQLPGIYLAVQIDVHMLVALLVAGLTATGTNWLLRDHPAIGKRHPLEHLLLPTLTAWVIALPLFQLPSGALWWITFSLGGVVLILVLLAEYIAVDPEDVRHAPAAAGLTAVAFALYLVLAATLRYAGLRLFLILPTLTLAVSLVSLRSLRLRLSGQWSLVQVIVITLISAQLAAALHYWPLSPVSYGLALLGPAYALTSLLGDLAEGETLRSAAIEPLVVLILVWLSAFWLR
jgi:hypothetical protein